MTDAQSQQPTNSAVSEAAPSLSQPTIAASEVAGIRVHNLSEDEAVDAIVRLIDKGGSHYAAVVNAAKIVAANEDNALKRALLEADMVTADGMSVVWASRVLGQPLKERVTGIELFERLVRRASERGWAMYFLGAREESVRGVVERFTSKYPGLRVAGYRNGYFDASESAAIAELIKQSSTDLLFVAMGSPAQERWITSNLEATGARFALGVGGSFDHVTGLARRAPGWMQRSGLEWLYRLIREPRRLWRRYLVGNSIFLWLVLRQRLRSVDRRLPE
jgi:N-acetylglucosaminyldiphosphoundecaprenol N-acetyl-beta-D-mannosaminyltransferase